MSKFAFATVVRGPVAIVTLHGELDLATTAELTPELDRLLEEPRYDVVAIDLRELEFMDSSGLRTIIVTRNRLSAEDRRLVLVRGPRAVMRVFEITRMTERLEFVETPEAVLT